MKFITYVAIAATLFAVAAAVTSTTYTDTACKTAAAGTADAPNPLVLKLNECTKVGTSGGYGKASACATGGKYAGGFYSDDKCATLVQAQAGDEGKCVTLGTGSMMTTCASTSSVTMAFLAVAAAVLALSF